MDKFNKAVNAIYDYVYSVDPNVCKKNIDQMLMFIIRLHHSFVDNDKPSSNFDVNMNILRLAELGELEVGEVPVSSEVDLREKKRLC